MRFNRISVRDLEDLASSLATDGSSSSPLAEEFLRECRWIMSGILGSPKACAHSWCHIKVLITLQGLPGIWMTVAPSDLQSLLVLKLNGHQINLDLGSAQNLPSPLEH